MEMRDCQWLLSAGIGLAALLSSVMYHSAGVFADETKESSMSAAATLAEYEGKWIRSKTVDDVLGYQNDWKAFDRIEITIDKRIVRDLADRVADAARKDEFSEAIRKHARAKEHELLALAPCRMFCVESMTDCGFTRCEGKTYLWLPFPQIGFQPLPCVHVSGSTKARDLLFLELDLGNDKRVLAFTRSAK